MTTHYCTGTRTACDCSLWVTTGHFHHDYEMLSNTEDSAQVTCSACLEALAEDTERQLATEGFVNPEPFRRPTGVNITVVQPTPEKRRAMIEELRAALKPK